jgi:hypothetical protein
VILLNFSQKQIKIAKTLASFAPVYQNAILKQQPNVEKQFNENPADNYFALEFFLSHYAYERQGSPKAYPKIAKQTIETIFQGKLKNVNSDQPTKAWKKFKKIAANDFNGINTNEKLNPMNCSNGVLKIMVLKEVTNIANHVKKQIIKEKKIRKAHEFIDSITGIGPKIASFYLRDIVYLADLKEEQIEDQFYLQPMDTWLEQAYILIEGKKSENREKKQDTFVKLCEQADCSPIAFNQGAWLVGAKIAGEYNKFEKIALGQAESKDIIEKYVKEQRAYISEIENAIAKN